MISGSHRMTAVTAVSHRLVGHGPKPGLCLTYGRICVFLVVGDGKCSNRGVDMCVGVVFLWSRNPLPHPHFSDKSLRSAVTHTHRVRMSVRVSLESPQSCGGSSGSCQWMMIWRSKGTEGTQRSGAW